MIRDSVIDWQELSALYEHADALEEEELPAWLSKLQAQRHRLLPQLQKMLSARAKIIGEDFLRSLPRIEATAPIGLSEWAEGSRIGAYRLSRHIGSGGMAEVWLADRVDGAFSRQVAIKLLFQHASSRELDSFARRFSRERDILASLNHANIAGLHDAGVTANGQPWLALEYVEGKPITVWFDENRTGIRDRIEIFKQVLLAVQHAHANLVIHRDLKPANILVTPQGQVWLLDFGIAKLIEPDGGALVDSELTREAGRPLTLHYASPEQILGQPLTTACDVYSLGVVLYEVLCGERPYELDLGSAAQVEQAILNVDPREPSRRNLSVHAAILRATTPKGLARTLFCELDAIVGKCLSKRAKERYSSVEALAADLDNWLQGRPVTARPSKPLERVWKFARRHRLAVSATAVATVAMVTLTVLALLMGFRARDESARAEAARDFMVEMFRTADPDRSKGTEPTLRDVLEHASDRAVVDLKKQPALLADVLDIVSQMQGNLGLFTVADTTLSRLAALYQRLGQQRNFAVTQAARAMNAYQLGDDARAEVLVAEATTAAAPFADDHMLQAKLVLVQGWVARGAGKYAEARERMTSAAAQSALAFGPNNLQTIEAIRGLAEVEGELRHHEVALRLLAEAVSRASSDASVDERYRLEVAIARANALLRAGQFKEATLTAKDLMPECERVSGKHNSDCDFLRRLLAVSELRSEVPESALSLANDLLVASADSSAPVLQAVSLMSVARLLAENGRLDTHPELRNRLAELGDATSRPTIYRVQAFLTLAEVDILAGAFAEAERWARRAMSLQEGDGSPVHQQGRTKVTLALTLSGQGRHEEALARLESAEFDLDVEYGADHPLRLLYGLNRAVFLQRLRRTPEAVAVVDAGLPTIRAAFGSSSSVVQRAEAMRGDWQKVVRSRSESARSADMFF